MEASPQNSGKQKRGARYARLGIALAVTVAALWLLVRQVAGTDELFTAIGRIDWRTVFGTFLLGCLALLLGGIRWRIVIRALGYRVRLPRILVTMLAAWPPMVIMPARANELLRAWAVRDAMPVYVGVSSILAEKVIDLVVLFAMAGIGAAALGLWNVAIIGGGGAVAGISLCVLLVRRRIWLESLPFFRNRKDKLDALFSAFETLRRKPLATLGVVITSVAVRTVGVIAIFLLLGAVGVSLSFWLVLAIWPTALLAGLLPFTLAGMGTRDATFVLLVTAAAAGTVSDAALVAASLTYAVTQLWSFTVIGIPFMLREAARNRAAAHLGEAAPAGVTAEGELD